MPLPGDLVSHYSDNRIGLVIRVEKLTNMGYVYHIRWCDDDMLHVAQHWEEEVVLVSWQEQDKDEDR